KDPGAAFAITNEYHSSAALDYCLIELGSLIKPSKDNTFKQPAPASLGVEPELEHNSGIYVAGHPEGRPLSVALNCQVVFPYRLENQDALTQLIGWALLRMFNSPKDYTDHAAMYSEELDTFFKSHYKALGPPGLY